MNHLLKQKDKILSNVEGKTALVCRYGAIGDLIMITPVLKELKKQGYYVVMNMQTPSNVVLTSNPYIDAKIVQKPDEIDRKELDEYWDKLSEGFDKFIIATHYLGEMIENHFGDGKRWDVHIEYLREKSPLGTAGALSLLDTSLKEPLTKTCARTTGTCTTPILALSSPMASGMSILPAAIWVMRF